MHIMKMKIHLQTPLYGHKLPKTNKAHWRISLLRRPCAKREKDKTWNSKLSSYRLIHRHHMRSTTAYFHNITILGIYRTACCFQGFEKGQRKCQNLP